jgi:hypothetical protein
MRASALACSYITVPSVRSSASCPRGELSFDVAPQIVPLHLHPFPQRVRPPRLADRKASIRSQLASSD